jgi:hypothetical protein
MKQSRTMSLVEAFANVVVGYGVAVVAQILVFPLFGLSTTLAQNMAMGAQSSPWSALPAVTACAGHLKLCG